MRPALALLLLAVLAFLPFFDFPEWRGTEARRVQIAAEMVSSGDYIVPRLWGEETHAKPPFYYWVLAASFHLFGVHAWSARLPSVLGFWMLALIAFRFVRRWHGHTAACLGAFGVLASPIVMHDVPFAEIDPLFAVLTASSMMYLADGVFGRDRRALLFAGVLGGLAVMTKGPPYLMFFVGPFVLWWKRDRCRGILWFLPPLFLFYVVYKFALESMAPTADVGGVALEETVGRLSFWTVDSLAGMPEHLAVAVVVIGLPFSFWLPTWFRTVRREVDRQTWRTNFLVWGAISGVLVLLFSTDRSTRYLLPAVPMAIVGLAPVVVDAFRDESAPAPWVRRSASVFGVLIGAALIVLPWMPHPYPGQTWVGLIALGSVGLVVHSRAQLTRFVMVMPLFVAWSAFADREVYARTASDFVPSRAAVLARELDRRAIRSIETDGHVGTAILLHAKRAMGDRLRVVGDHDQHRKETAQWLVVVDGGVGKVREVSGYREVLRVQVNRKKSLSLRERL